MITKILRNCAEA